MEIRQFDIGSDSGYLAKNYPLEMRMMRYWFADILIAGFDWLGDDLENKKIPDGYWNNISPIKHYERELENDSIYRRRADKCDSISEKRLQILKSKSLREILISDDGRLTNEYYACLAAAMQGSIHTRVLSFYETRNRKMLENIQSIISSNAGKRIVILTGDDHYVYLKDRFSFQPLFDE